MSRGSAGNCAAVGSYRDRCNETYEGFAVSETNGVGGKAIEVPGPGTFQQGRHAYVYSVSCTSARSRAADGTYADRHGHQQGFVTEHRFRTLRRS